MTEHQTLKVLNTLVNFQYGGMYPVFPKILATNTIEDLKLKIDFYDDEDLDALANYVSTSKSLRKLDLKLSGTEDYFAGRTSLFSVLSSDPNQLESVKLELTFVQNILDGLAQMIRASKVLYSIEINEIKGSDAAEQLLDAVSKSTSLIKCFLGTTNLFHSFFETAVKKLRVNTILKKLDYLDPGMPLRNFTDRECVAFQILKTYKNMWAIQLMNRREGSYCRNDNYIDLDIYGLLFDVRLFCGTRAKESKGHKSRVIPSEVLEKILFFAHYDNKILYEDQLRVIIRSLLDRRTLGKIVFKDKSPDLQPSKNLLYVRCRNALEFVKNV
jgi:hypothetical protein